MSKSSSTCTSHTALSPAHSTGSTRTWKTRSFSSQCLDLWTCKASDNWWWTKTTSWSTVLKSATNTPSLCFSKCCLSTRATSTDQLSKADSPRATVTRCAARSLRHELRRNDRIWGVGLQQLVLIWWVLKEALAGVNRREPLLQLVRLTHKWKTTLSQWKADVVRIKNRQSADQSSRIPPITGTRLASVSHGAVMTSRTQSHS